MKLAFEMAQFVTYGLIVLNVAVSYVAFRQKGLFERLTFEVQAVKAGQWYRLLSAGFIHVSWSHLLFNMVTLYFFAGAALQALGLMGFIAVYLGSLLAGNFLALAFHYRHPLYRAVGASGAVSGVVFAAIALFPGMKLALVLIPIPLPAWLFGLGFVLYSVYGIRSNRDNIGHEAHLGGALAGLLVTLAFEPILAQTNTLTIVLIAAPALVFIVVSFYRPRLLHTVQGDEHNYQTIDDAYHHQKKADEAEVNRLLEKINQRGRGSLSAQEKDFLKNYGP